MKFYRNTGFLVLSIVTAFFLAACGGGGGGGSSAPPTPVVVTGSATGITNVGATLNGTVNPNGLATEAWFEWGTSATLATFDNTAKQPFVAGTTVQSVSASIPGLTFGTTYFFRMVASNSSGVSKGTIGNFSTAAQRPTVTTLAADNLAATSATLHGEVNPNSLITQAWFEYGTDNVIFQPTPAVAVGSGSAVVTTSANISGLAPGGTVYFRAAASNPAGEQKGTTLSLSTSNPPPVANAGPDNTVEMGQTVTLDGSGSTTPIGTIISRLWTQVNGTPTVTLSDNTAAKPTFTAPTVPVIGAVLRFELEVTNSALQTSTDNVDITVKWVGFTDDFSTDTTGNYTVVAAHLLTQGTFTWDGTGQRVEIGTGAGFGVQFSDTVLSTSSGVFSFDFTPTVPFGSHGGFWIRIMQDANNYYLISNFDYATNGGTIPAPPGSPDPLVDLAQIVKVVGGVVTDNVYLPVTAYSQNTTHNLSLSFSPTQLVLSGFGSPVTLNTSNNTAISVGMFEFETGQQDAFYDNIKVLALP